METSIKTGFAQIFSRCPKNLSWPKFGGGGCSPPRPPGPYAYAWASLSFVPPGWGANSSQSCRSCSFSGHKQRRWTVLSELRYKIAYNPNSQYLFPELGATFSRKAVEDALQYSKMYVAGVWTKTAKRYFKNVAEQVIRRQSKVWNNL